MLPRCYVRHHDCTYGCSNFRLFAVETSDGLLEGFFGLPVIGIQIMSGILPKLHFRLQHNHKACGLSHLSVLFMFILMTTSGRSGPECALCRVMSSEQTQDEHLTNGYKHTTITYKKVAST